MIATGTDIKPVEIVMFMRTVKSRVLFEQMKGRGVRVIDPTELQAVTPDAKAKTHFVIVDCVGADGGRRSPTRSRWSGRRRVSFKALLEHVALGGTDPDYYSSLASRLARLDQQCGAEREPANRGGIRRRVARATSPRRSSTALDADQQEAKRASSSTCRPTRSRPRSRSTRRPRRLLKRAAEPLATKPALRQVLQDLKQQFEQIIDEISKDVLIEAGHSAEAKEKARALVQSFEKFIAENKDEIDALQFFYSRPHKERLRYEDIQQARRRHQSPPRSWTPRAVACLRALEKDKVRGARRSGY